MTVTFNQAKPYTDNRHSRSWIESKMTKRRGNEHLLGLTASKLQWQVNSKFTVRTWRLRQKSCISLTHVKLEYGFGETPVFIDQRYRPGSCNFKVIYNHEAEHVRTMNREGNAVKQWIESNMIQLANAIDSRVTMDVHAAKQQMFRELQTKSTSMLETLKARLERAHGRLDTVENYKRTSKLCPRW